MSKAKSFGELPAIYPLALSLARIIRCNGAARPQSFVCAVAERKDFQRSHCVPIAGNLEAARRRPNGSTPSARALFREPTPRYDPGQYTRSRPLDDLSLLIDLHREAHRQGPGGDDETRLAITLSGLSDRTDLKIADIGCGTGASTLVLAQALDATVTAVDFLPDFLHELDVIAKREQLGERIETLAASMDALPFEEQSFDAIWSEGAIYHIGFENGIKAWRRFLKPDGLLAVSELTWLTPSRPAELEQHWNREYPEVDTASAKIALLECHGFSLVGYFPLPTRCWLDNYYRPMQARFAAFLARHGQSEAAAAIVAAEKQEIALYERHSAFVSYGYYVARRTAD
jgi:SAM-dependent methyltransferase